MLAFLLIWFGVATAAIWLTIFDRHQMGKWLVSGFIAAISMFLVGCLFELAEWLAGVAVVGAIFRSPSMAMPYLYHHPLPLGLLFAFAWLRLSRSANETSKWQRLLHGAGLGAILFLAGSFPIWTMEYASIDLQLHLVVIWMLRNFAQYLAAGAMLGLTHSPAS